MTERKSFFTDEEISAISMPGVEVSSVISSLNVAFDVVAYLQGHSEAEMFDMLGKLKDFLE